MRSILRSHYWLLAAGLLAAAGCGQAPLNIEKTYTLDPGDQYQQFLFVDAPVTEQKVSVATQSGGQPINVYVVLGDTKVAAEEALKKKAFVASAEKTADPKLDATIPANKGYTVVLEAAGKKTDVKVKVTGR